MNSSSGVMLQVNTSTSFEILCLFTFFATVLVSDGLIILWSLRATRKHLGCQQTSHISSCPYSPHSLPVRIRNAPRACDVTRHHVKHAATRPGPFAGSELRRLGWFCRIASFVRNQAHRQQRRRQRQTQTPTCQRRGVTLVVLATTVLASFLRLLHGGVRSMIWGGILRELALF